MRPGLALKGYIMIAFAAFWHRLLPPFCHARDLTRLACVSITMRRVLQGAHIDLGDCDRRLNFERIWKNWTIRAIRYNGDLREYSDKQRAQLTKVNTCMLFNFTDLPVQLLQACPNVTNLVGLFSKRVFDALSLQNLHSRLEELELHTQDCNNLDLLQCNRLTTVTLRFGTGLPPNVWWPSQEQIHRLVLIKHVSFSEKTLERSWIGGLLHVRTFKTFGSVIVSTCFLKHLAPRLETMELSQQVYGGNWEFPRLKALRVLDIFDDDLTTFRHLEKLTIDVDSLAYYELLASNGLLPDVVGKLQKLCLDFRHFDANPFVGKWITQQSNLLVLDLSMWTTQFPSICSPTLREFKFRVSSPIRFLRLRLRALHLPALQHLTIVNATQKGHVYLKIANHKSPTRLLPRLQRLELREVLAEKRILVWAQIQVVHVARETCWKDLY